MKEHLLAQMFPGWSSLRENHPLVWGDVGDMGAELAFKLTKFPVNWIYYPEWLEYYPGLPKYYPE